MFGFVIFDISQDWVKTMARTKTSHSFKFAVKMPEKGKNSLIKYGIFIVQGGQVIRLQIPTHREGAVLCRQV